MTLEVKLMNETFREMFINQYSFLKVKDSEYYNTWTNCWLDEFEPGWKNSFGENFCKELDEAIKKDGCEDTFEFLQIKEKFGSLRLYAAGYYYEGNINKILYKYEELSRYICGHCGKPATRITRGWIYPLCDECIKDISGESSPIEDFYDFNSYEDVLKEIESIKNGE